MSDACLSQNTTKWHENLSEKIRCHRVLGLGEEDSYGGRRLSDVHFYPDPLVAAGNIDSGQVQNITYFCRKMKSLQNKLTVYSLRHSS